MQKIYVNKNSEINTIEKAFSSIIDDEAIIYISNGTYYEKNKLTHSNVTIIGESKDGVIIYYDDYALKIHEDKKEYNTFRTYTLLIHANNVHLENLTISNTSGYGPKIEQAVALSLLGDNITVTNCSFKAHQDTIFLGPLPKNLIIRYIDFLPDDEREVPNHYRISFTNCYIEGTVDYIFGCANCYFDNCTFHNLLEGGFVFAPSTYQEDFYGFTCNNCQFTSNFSTPSTYLARPWRDYGKVVLINCLMGNHILDCGWNKWLDTTRDKTCRFYEFNSQYFDHHQFTRVTFSKELSLNDLNLYSKENVHKS